LSHVTEAASVIEDVASRCEGQAEPPVGARRRVTEGVERSDLIAAERILDALGKVVFASAGGNWPNDGV
jgi:hypothetical protein